MKSKQFRRYLDNCLNTSGTDKNVQFRKFEYHAISPWDTMQLFFWPSVIQSVIVQGYIMARLRYMILIFPRLNILIMCRLFWSICLSSVWNIHSFRGGHSIMWWVATFLCFSETRFVWCAIIVGLVAAIHADGKYWTLAFITKQTNMFMCWKWRYLKWLLSRTHAARTHAQTHTHIV